MIDELVRIAEKQAEERREIIRSNDFLRGYEKSVEVELSLIHRAAEAFKQKKMISTEHLDYVYGAYRKFLWTLFASCFSPDRMEQLVDNAERLCKEFGDERYGCIEDYYREEEELGDEAMSTRLHLVWLVRAYNCMIQGINLKILIDELEAVHYIIENDEPLHRRKE